MNIGILGGSFDPIHNGHMHMAYQSLIEYNLDEIWIIPAGHSPNKDENKMTSAYHRLNMCNYACSDNAKIKALDYEIKSNERSYTYRTLERLKEDYPDARVVGHRDLPGVKKDCPCFDVNGASFME